MAHLVHTYNLHFARKNCKYELFSNFTCISRKVEKTMHVSEASKKGKVQQRKAFRWLIKYICSKSKCCVKLEDSSSQTDSHKPWLKRSITKWQNADHYYASDVNLSLSDGWVWISALWYVASYWSFLLLLKKPHYKESRWLDCIVWFLNDWKKERIKTLVVTMCQDKNVSPTQLKISFLKKLQLINSLTFSIIRLHFQATSRVGMGAGVFR